MQAGRKGERRVFVGATIAPSVLKRLDEAIGPATSRSRVIEGLIAERYPPKEQSGGEVEGREQHEHVRSL